VQVAVEQIKRANFKGNVYIFPGDAGLINSDTIRNFKIHFERRDSDVMLLTGNYTDTPESNPYGRIVRETSSEGSSAGQVLGIIQAKDILSLSPDGVYKFTLRDSEYNFTREELLNISEFDSGIMAFKSEELIKHIGKLKPDNVQKELYLTDLVKIFRQAELKVEAYQNDNSDVLLGFNSRTDLKKMESIIRRQNYEQLKDIVTFADEENFFVDSQIVKQILELDREGAPVDIVIGEGASISAGVKLNRGVIISKGAVLDGNIILGKKVKIGDNVYISTYQRQKLYIGDNTEIFSGDIIKGNVKIGKNVRIETGVRITGSNKNPTYIGDNCIIKGTTYIFGSIIENNCWIQHSVIMNRRVRCIMKRGKIQKICFILPEAKGLEAITPL
ncbi:MAG: multidrug transporter, partial [Elusimicrobiota bacterium]|nr:multidrug transporter [Elusimicrobiota bacterium]